MLCRSLTPPIQPSLALASLSPGSGNCSNSSGNDITQHLANHLVLLLKIIHSQRWSAFENIALSNANVFQIICTTIPNIKEFRDGETLLHVCLRYDPPLKIVMKMMKMSPDLTSALRAQDYMGRTPLHIAAACDADPMVVKLLSSINPTTCTILDEDSRTPLHLACDSSFNLLQDQDENDTCHPERVRQRDVPSCGTVCALLSEALDASLFEDRDGMNALECAILSDASIEVVTLLQKASMQLHRERDTQQSRKKSSLIAGQPCGQPNEKSRLGQYLELDQHHCHIRFAVGRQI